MGVNYERLYRRGPSQVELVEHSAIRLASEVEEAGREFAAQPEYIRQILQDWSHLSTDEQAWMRKSSEGLTNPAEKLAEIRRTDVATVPPSGRTGALVKQFLANIRRGFLCLGKGLVATKRQYVAQFEQIGV